MTLSDPLGTRTEYTASVEHSRSGHTDPECLKVSHHVNYPGTPVTWGSDLRGWMSFVQPHWAGTVNESNDGTITAFLAVSRGPNKKLGKFKSTEEAIQTVIDFNRAYREAGIVLWDF